MIREMTAPRLPVWGKCCEPIKQVAAGGRIPSKIHWLVSCTGLLLIGLNCAVQGHDTAAAGLP